MTAPIEFRRANAIRDARGLKPSDKLVLYVIGTRINRRTGECFASFDGLAEDTGFSRRECIRAVERLKGLGLLASFSRSNPNGRAANGYRIDLAKLERQTVPAGHSHSASGALTVVPPGPERSDGVALEQIPGTNPSEQIPGTNPVREAPTAPARTNGFSDEELLPVLEAQMRAGQRHLDACRERLANTRSSTVTETGTGK